MPLDVQGTFVSQKISKVRWIPEDYVETKCFVTGSWDDDVNSIKVWNFESPHEDEEVEYPRALSEYQVEGDVTQIQFTEKNKIAVSTSNGDVKLLEISAYERQSPLREVFSWKKLHNYGWVFHLISNFTLNFVYLHSPPVHRRYSTTPVGKP